MFYTAGLGFKSLNFSGKNRAELDGPRYHNNGQYRVKTEACVSRRPITGLNAARAKK